jgi:hypothetical protein
VVVCGREIPASDRGSEPGAMVTLTVDVKQQSLSSTDVHVGSIGIAEGSRERLANCVREKIGTVKLATPNEPDRTGYVVQFPIRVR